MQEIKNCIFCGREILYVQKNYDPAIMLSPKMCVKCNQCGACGPLADDENEAILKWNSLIKSMNKITNEIEAGIAKGKSQKSDATNPSHYSRWKIEPLDFISVNNLDFLRGNIIKYIMRYDAKGGLEDLRKARVYLDRLIDKVEKENDQA